MPLKPRRRLRRIIGDFASLLANPPRPEERDDYVDITLTDEKPVLDPEGQLRSLYPYNLGVHQLALEYRYAALDSSSAQAGEASRLRRSNAATREMTEEEVVQEDFASFFKEMKGEEPDEATCKLFDDLLREAMEAASASE